MGINCPSCGGKMYFDISTQMLKCSYCDTSQMVETYQENNEGETQQMMYDTVVFTCRNCGAELTAPDEQTVAYCSYCGSEQMLTAKHEQLLRPKRIIPFKKSKQEAIEAYADALKGKLYVPKEFKDPRFLEGFRGIYLPYYSYSAIVPKREVLLKGNAQYTSGSYDYDEDYDIYASLGGRTPDVDFDASSAFDDTLANEIAPFEARQLTDFHEGYLAGLYADKATSSGSVYLRPAEELAAESVYSDIDKRSSKVKVIRPKTTEQMKAEIGITSVDCDVSLFPVWFLTWRNKERVAYSVMNGQSGKIAMDIPISKKKFLLVSLIAAIILSAILCFLPMFILPKSLCSIAAIILMISGILLRNELRRIYERENHVYDYGDTQHTAKKKEAKAQEATETTASGGSKKKKKATAGWIGCLIPAIYIFIWAGIALFRGASFFVELLSGSHLIVFVIITPIQLVFSVLTIIHASNIDRKTAIIPAIFAPLVLIAGIVIAIINSPYDFWYYGTALACLLATILNAISAMNYFNYLTTRPVPNFFRREGADNAR